MNSKSAKLFPSPDLDGAVARTASSESPSHALKDVLIKSLKKQCQKVYFGEDQGRGLSSPNKVEFRIKCLMRHRTSLCFAIPLDTGQMDEFSLLLALTW